VQLALKAASPTTVTMSSATAPMLVVTADVSVRVSQAF
jgi:hypothetical protein